jgi:hypothetical protein
MVAALAHAALDDLALVTEASGGEAKLVSEMREVLAADIAQFDMLEVGPDALVRVQIGGVAGELLQPDASSASLGQELLHRLATMDRGTIPEHQELAGDVTAQVLQETDDVRAFIRVRLHVHQQPAGRGDATDHRQMVATQRQAEDGGLATRGVGPDRAWEEVEARFVDPDDGPPFLVSPFFSAGQRSVRQASMAASFRWLARWTGFWTLQPAARRRLPT